MMTPAQVKAYEFKSAGRNAYKAEDVDAFLGEVAVDYEKMYRENSELIKRVSLLADKLEQYKNDEMDIKQAVLTAQKAANLIVKEAEESVADSKSEAEAILSAAKGEAEIIKADAERQAIADSELLLSVTKDKAEEIIAKAKDKAHTILIEADNSAKNTMGAANRTITSESLRYDMLKKEVSEFKASILAQYKAHIELISKLPELVIEDASETENKEEINNSKNEIQETKDIEIDDSVIDVVDDGILEFVEEDEAEASVEDTIEENFDEPVVKTELPYDFFADDTSLEFVEEEKPEEPIATIDEFEANCGINTENDPHDIPISKRFSVDVNRLDSDSTEEEVPAQTDIEETPAVTEIDDNFGYDDDESDDGSVNSAASFFDMIEKVEAEDVDQNQGKRFGFFRKKK